MKTIIFEKDYEVSSVNININKRLGLFGMLGILQDIGTIHAGLLGVGIDEMIKNNAFWVFVQQKLIMTEWPMWQDVIRVKTYPRALDGLKAYRDYEIFLGDKKIGESVGAFMVLSGDTRRPIKPIIDEEIHLNSPKNVLEIMPKKIQMPEGMKIENKIVVRNSDLDMNNHVNNTKYSQWILDSIPISNHREYVVQEFNINFLAEAHLGDEIDIFMAREELDISSYYQGIRKSDQKIIFAAHIIGKKI